MKKICYAVHFEGLYPGDQSLFRSTNVVLYLFSQLLSEWLKQSNRSRNIVGVFSSLIYSRVSKFSRPSDLGGWLEIGDFP